MGRTTVVLALAAALSAPAMADWIAGTIPGNYRCMAVDPAANKAYVADWDGHGAVIDAAAMTVSVIPLGGTGAQEAAVNPVTNRAYIPGTPFHTVIDGSTHDTTLVPAVAGCSYFRAAVNPVTNKVYVFNLASSRSVTVIDGATNDTSSIGLASSGSAIAVNPVTNRIYVANAANNVTVIDGATNDTVLVPAGEAPAGIAANPVTNKIYVANARWDMTVIDGATNTVRSVPASGNARNVVVDLITNRVYAGVYGFPLAYVMVVDGAADTVCARVTLGTDDPYYLAVNPIAGKVYAGCAGRRFFVIGGRSGDTTSFQLNGDICGVAANPVTGQAFALSSGTTVLNAMQYGVSHSVSCGLRPPALNPVAAKVYVPDPAGGRVLVFDCLTRDTALVPAGVRPWSVDLNPVTNTAWVANPGSGNVTVIDGATHDTMLVPTGGAPCAVGVNFVTNKVYVADSVGNRVVVIDGTTRDTLSVPAGAYPCAVAVEPTTNKVYVANRSVSSVTVIDGLTNDTALVPVGDSAFKLVLNRRTNRVYVATRAGVSVINGQTLDTALVDHSGVKDVCVNPVTNRVYAALGDPSSGVLEIDGASLDTTVLAAVARYLAVEVNPVTNKVYARAFGVGGQYVIDGAGHGWVCLSGGGFSAPSFLAVNPVLNRAYRVGGISAGQLDEIAESPWNDTRVRATMDPVPGCTTSLAQPALTGTAVNSLDPNPTGILGVLAGTSPRRWSWASRTGSSDSVRWTSTWGGDSLVMGENLICCLPLEYQAGTTNNLGPGVPFAGNLAVYPLYRMEYHVGQQERAAYSGHSTVGPTIVRGLLRLGPAADGSRQELMDVCGRRVMELRPGDNDVSRMASGVYFLCPAGRFGGEPGFRRAARLILAR